MHERAPTTSEVDGEMAQEENPSVEEGDERENPSVEEGDERENPSVEEGDERKNVPQESPLVDESETAEREMHTEIKSIVRKREI